MRIAVSHSPHQNGRPDGARPRLIVLHADAGTSEAGTIAWLVNPASKVSYHYLVGRDGSITQFVADERRAWHAGVSAFAGVSDCNDYAIGVCFANRMDGEPYTAAAIDMGVQLVTSLMHRYSIPLDGITTHEQIARPIGRKQDPGVLFPLAQFITAVRRKLST